MTRYPDPQRSKVALIGTSDYEYEKNQSRLPAIRNNLVGLEHAFTNPSTGVFLSENCTVADSPDSPKSMIQRIRRAARETEDVLVTYYAGHGHEARGKLYLSVRETDPHQLDGTAVPFEWVRDAIQESPADIRILILDCCFSGRAIGAMSSDSAAFGRIKISGTTILTSTTANEVSLAIPGERYTAFTAELIKLFATPTDGPLTLGSLYRPLSAAMARRSLPSPKISIGDSSGDIILRRPLEPLNEPEVFRSGVPDFDKNQKSNNPGPFSSAGLQSDNYRRIYSTASFDGPQSGQKAERLHRPSYRDLYRRSLSVVSQMPSSMRQPVKSLSIFLLICSVILSGGVLAAGIDQAIRGPYTDGIVGIVFAITFVAAWFAGSILPLIRMIKKNLNRRRERATTNPVSQSRDRRSPFNQEEPQARSSQRRP